MATLTSALPAPVRAYEIYSDARPATAAAPAAAPQTAVPPYGRRKGFVPKSQADFADGGAYPEILVAQYPLDMGRPGKASSTAIVPVSMDAKTGQARFDSIVTAQHGDKKVQTQFGDLVEKNPATVVKPRPSAEEEAAVAARTSAALAGIVAQKTAESRPGYVTSDSTTRAESAQYIRYTPAEDANGYNAATKQRIIRMVDAPVDPFEPPKFKHKKVPAGPGDAPVPVMHSPPRKLTAADQAAWDIPPCVSNWKNARAYVIPLDKRMAADGRNLLETSINDGFAKLSESLLIAERKARVEVETRAAIAKRLALKEKEGKEAELRAIAAKSRLERAGVALPAAHPAAAGGGGGFDDFEGAAPSTSGGARPVGVGGVVRSRAEMSADDDHDDDGGYGAPPAASSSSRAASRAMPAGGSGGDAAAGAADAEERERLRREFRRDKEREMRGQFDDAGNNHPAAGATGGGASGPPSKRPRPSGGDHDDGDRDISEKVALGMPVGRGAASAGAEGLFDARLFNQSEGIGSGFGGDDEYHVYSKAWRTDAAAAGGSAIYRPRTGAGGAYDPEAAEAAVASLRSGGTDFEGVATGSSRTAAGVGGGRGGIASSGPVQFEKSYSTSGATSVAPPSAPAAAPAAASGRGGASGDVFGLDQFLSETSSSSSSSRGGGAGRNALDAIGKSAGHGYMSAAAGGGGGGRSAADYAGGSSRGSISFVASGTETSNAVGGISGGRR